MRNARVAGRLVESELGTLFNYTDAEQKRPQLKSRNFSRHRTLRSNPAGRNVIDFLQNFTLKNLKLTSFSSAISST